MPTATSGCISLSRGNTCEKLRHRSMHAATKRYYSTSHMPTHKRRITCAQAALTETDRLLPLLKHAGAATKLARDRSSSTSANTKSLISRWDAFVSSERRAAI